MIEGAILSDEYDHVLDGRFGLLMIIFAVVLPRLLSGNRTGCERRKRDKEHACNCALSPRPSYGHTCHVFPPLFYVDGQGFC